MGLMKQDKHIRKVQAAVDCFITNGDEFLMLKRAQSKKIDPGKLNGIGGRVDPGENFLEAAIREIEEETGYVLDEKAFKLVGVIRLEGGYSEDWVMCFFKVEVSSKQIPIGNKTDDGELLWLHKDKILDSGYELIDDLNYCFKDIIKSEGTFFMNAEMNKDEKVDKVSISKVK
ncbi:NUDIX domain-containing protein [Candidatus Dojkabacteria bacterium]|nr:NUDIX domain-containing protein [Candidatus Dojkabacteria bacterium]